MLHFIDKLSNKSRLFIICGALLLGIASMSAGAVRIHATGTPVILATAPVDPRSLFQGDYVVLRYDISTIDRKLLSANEPVLTGRGAMPIYVELQPGTPIWTAVKASSIRFEPQAGNLIIAGKLVGDGSMRARYGIESFLVPEGEGGIIERMGWTDRSRVTVRVLVAPDGAALPQNILIDGKPVFDDAGM